MAEQDIVQAVSSVLGEKIKGRKGLKGVPKFDTEFLEVATRLVAAGFTEKELGYVFGVAPRRIQGWKKDPLFKQACVDGRKLAKQYLVARGLRAAAGYDYIEENVKTKTRINKETNEVEEYVAERSTFHKHQKPDGGLLAFLLTNLSRQCKDEIPFVSQHKVEIDEHKDINIHMTGKKALEHLDRLAGAFMDKHPVIDTEFEKPKKIKGETENDGKA